MVKALVFVVGLLTVGGALAAAWYGDGANREMEKLDMEIVKQQSDNAYRHAGEAGEKKIAEVERKIEEKKGERNRWFGAAIGAGVVGLAMTLLSLTRKRKVGPSDSLPAQNQVPAES